jgi:hypothetical protein
MGRGPGSASSCWRAEGDQEKAEMAKGKDGSRTRPGVRDVCAKSRGSTAAATDDARQCWTSAKSRRVPSLAPIGQARPKLLLSCPKAPSITHIESRPRLCFSLSRGLLSHRPSFGLKNPCSLFSWENIHSPVVRLLLNTVHHFGRTEQDAIADSVTLVSGAAGIRRRRLLQGMPSPLVARAQGPSTGSSI